MKLINIGFGNMVSANRLVAIVSPEIRPYQTNHPRCPGAGDADRRNLWAADPSGDYHGFGSCGTVSGAAGDSSKPPVRRRG